MVESAAIPDETETLAKWQIAKHPQGRQKSAVMALLDIVFEECDR